MKRKYNWLLCWRAENIGGWRGAKLQAVCLVPEYVVGPRTFKIKVGIRNPVHNIWRTFTRMYEDERNTITSNTPPSSCHKDLLGWKHSYVYVVLVHNCPDVDARHKRKCFRTSGQQQVVDIISRLDLHSPQSSRAISSWPLIVSPHGFEGIAEGKWLCRAHTFIGARVGIKTISFLHVSHSQAHDSSILHDV
jgi:hypothetical protein